MTQIQRDGFSIKHIEGGEEIHFVDCKRGGSMRERSFMGLMMRTDLDRFFVADTRDAAVSGVGEGK